MAQECGRPGLSWVDWNGTRAPTHPVAEDSNVKSGRCLLLKEVPWTILPPPCFPKGNLSDTFGKIRKASTLPIKWVSQDVPTRILPLTEVTVLNAWRARRRHGRCSSPRVGRPCHAPRGCPSNLCLDVFIPGGSRPQRGHPLGG